MKNIFKTSVLALFGSVALTSCGFDDDEGVGIEVNEIKIDSVKLAMDTMSINSTQNIKTYSTYASGCMRFHGYEYNSTSSQEAVIKAYQYDNKSNCSQQPYVGENILVFDPEHIGTYKIKFWSGDNTYITKTIVVEN